LTEIPPELLADIPPELLKTIREVLKVGYGKVVIKIVNGEIDIIVKKESVKVKK